MRIQRYCTSLHHHRSAAQDSLSLSSIPSPPLRRGSTRMVRCHNNYYIRYSSYRHGIGHPHQGCRIVGDVWKAWNCVLYVSLYVWEADLGDVTSTRRRSRCTQLYQGRNNRGKEVKPRYRYYDPFKCNQRYRAYSLLSGCRESKSDNIFTF